MTAYWIFYLVILTSGMGMLMFNYLQGHVQPWKISIWLRSALLFVPVLQGVTWGVEFASLVVGKK